MYNKLLEIDSLLSCWADCSIDLKKIYAKSEIFAVRRCEQLLEAASMQTALRNPPNNSRQAEQSSQDETIGLIDASLKITDSVSEIELQFWVASRALVWFGGEV